MKRTGFKRSKGFRRTKTEKQKAIDRADSLWSEIVKLRDNSTCQYCKLTHTKEGKEKVVQAHHIFSRTYKSTRWDTANGITLDKYCHKFIAHEKPELFRMFLINWMGEAEYLRLFAKSQIVKAHDVAASEIALEIEKAQVIQDLDNKIAELEG